MNTNEQKLQDLADAMLEKYKLWRDVAAVINEKNAKSEAPTRDEVNAYFATDKSYMEAKIKWESYMRELYGPH